MANNGVGEGKEDEKRPPTGVSIAVPLDVEEASPGCSWGAAFSAAASVKPQELGQDFLDRTAPVVADGGLEQIQHLAANKKKEPKEKKKKNKRKREYNEGKESQQKQPPSVNETAGDSSRATEKEQPRSEKKKRKRKEEFQTNPPFESHHHQETDADEPALEGRMVDHPSKGGTQIMVLVDPVRNLVYSAMRRSEEGALIRIGKIKEGGEWIWDEDSNECLEASQEEEEEEPNFPFPTVADDHCETPLEAYSHVFPLLERLSPNKDFKIYDPYYCNGAVKRHLHELGFPHVHNVKEDCYQVWSTRVGYPVFDVLITNPPYSSNHVERLMRYVVDCLGGKPWFLLMPNWVHKKDYYCSQKGAFYLVPKQRYVYLPPKNFRQKTKSDVHKKSSPFHSMWYIWGGTESKTRMLMDHAYKTVASPKGPCDLARSKSSLRDLRRKAKQRRK